MSVRGTYPISLKIQRVQPFSEQRGDQSHSHGKASKASYVITHTAGRPRTRWILLLLSRGNTCSRTCNPPDFLPPRYLSRLRTAMRSPARLLPARVGLADPGCSRLTPRPLRVAPDNWRRSCLAVSQHGGRLPCASLRWPVLRLRRARSPFFGLAGCRETKHNRRGRSAGATWGGCRHGAASWKRWWSGLEWALTESLVLGTLAAGDVNACCVAYIPYMLHRLHNGAGQTTVTHSACPERTRRLDPANSQCASLITTTTRMGFARLRAYRTWMRDEENACSV